MKAITGISFILLLFCIRLMAQNSDRLLSTNVRVNAPFEMPVIQIPDFRKCPQFNIKDFGAVTGNKNKTAAAIDQAIAKANQSGGGVVLIPQGEWLTKKLHLKSNVNLHLEKGAVLLFSENAEDYLPAVHSSWEGLECYNYSPLIYAYECENVAITGEGELKAIMTTWKKWAGRPAGHMNSLKRLYYMAYDRIPVRDRYMINDTANLRPQFIQFNRSKNILIEGVKITNSPFWTIHLYLSKDIVLRNLNVYAHGHNNDGVDPEMSQNVLIENCVFDQGDDAIAIKSGRAPEGWISKTPSKNIVMRNCTIKNGHQLVAIGSELSGGIENVLIEKCTVSENAKMFHVVFIKTNERMGGYVNNIYVRDIKAGKMDFGILGIETDVLYQWRTLVPTLERRLTPIKNVYLKNLKSTSVSFVSRVLGQQELPVENIQLVHIQADTIREGQRHLHENILKFSEK